MKNSSLNTHLQNDMIWSKLKRYIWKTVFVFNRRLDTNLRTSVGIWLKREVKKFIKLLCVKSTRDTCMSVLCNNHSLIALSIMFYRPQRNIDIDIRKEFFSEIIIPDILKSNNLSKKEGTGTFSTFNILVLRIIKQISEIKKKKTEFSKWCCLFGSVDIRVILLVKWE